MFRSLRPTLFTLASALAFGSASGAQITDPTLTLQPESPRRGQSTIVRVEATGSCTYIYPEQVQGNSITLRSFVTNCPSPPGPWLAYAVIPPLEVGAYELQLVDPDLEPLATTSFRVLDPDFTVEVTGRLPEPDRLELTATGIGSCVFDQPPTVEGTTIRWPLIPAGICDPPPPIEPLTWVGQIGPLEPGPYEIELLLREDVVATTQYEVEPIANCESTDTVLCLSGRFEVTARWTTPNGDSELATAEMARDDSGFFWFFGPDNIELLVKVHDACTSEFENYWFFASGLTNVEVQIHVRDTLAGIDRFYGNPQGRPFVPILDTAAFATCP